MAGLSRGDDRGRRAAGALARGGVRVDPQPERHSDRPSPAAAARPRCRRRRSSQPRCGRSGDARESPGRSHSRARRRRASRRRRRRLRAASARPGHARARVRRHERSAGRPPRAAPLSSRRHARNLRRARSAGQATTRAAHPSATWPARGSGELKKDGYPPHEACALVNLASPGRCPASHGVPHTGSGARRRLPFLGGRLTTETQAGVQRGTRGDSRLGQARAGQTAGERSSQPARVSWPRAPSAASPAPRPGRARALAQAPVRG